MSMTETRLIYRGISGEAVSFARKLRRKSTKAEQAFWKIVRNRGALGLKFRRQHPIGPFFADFYCHEFRLVVEIDGFSHTLPGASKRDERSTLYLEKEGYRVLRFTDERSDDRDYIISKIRDFLGIE